MEILNLAFSGFWHFIGFSLLFTGVLKTIAFIVNRFFRHLNIRKHGYPPEHCDGDGDLKNNIID